MYRILVMLSMVLVGCSSSQGTYTPGGSAPRSTDVIMDEARHLLQLNAPGAGSTSVEAPAELVWAALPAVYAQLGLQGRVLDDQRRVYGQPETSVRRRLQNEPLSRFLDCGSRSGIPNVNSYTVRLAVRTHVQAAGEGVSQIRTQVEANANTPGGGDPLVRCGSTNELERRIETRLILQLVRDGGP